MLLQLHISRRSKNPLTFCDCLLANQLSKYVVQSVSKQQQHCVILISLLLCFSFLSYDKDPVTLASKISFAYRQSRKPKIDKSPFSVCAVHTSQCSILAVCRNITTKVDSLLHTGLITCRESAHHRLVCR